MVAPLVFMSLLFALLFGAGLRRMRRGRADRTMYVTTWPEIEFRQLYGGWDADAYDAGTGHDRNPGPARLSGAPGRCVWSRPPARPK